MKLDLTKEQYRELLRAVYLADMVKHSMKETKDHSKSFIDAEQKLYSYHQAFESEDLIEQHDGVFMPTLKMESEESIHLRNYENAILEDQIAAVLARNDLEKEIMSGTVSENEAIDILIQLEEKYHQLIHEKGLSALTVK
ncbi:hypothetical protein KP77_20080 [Jeotgalibacillus alimentarius]|uniref:Uncharacterized protein n=1 Tax=Jeotgalibacillus alimentarius TaxID=135826 RepID=A0A0C2VIT7_9BACL|nr:hypothetical protein [Jeotgalibacillus alimentarius]KIL48797.1 hypothetical protein KP77_20080 [Jeotgalibacillus alimentarius]